MEENVRVGFKLLQNDIDICNEKLTNDLSDRMNVKYCNDKHPIHCFDGAWKKFAKLDFIIVL